MAFIIFIRFLLEDNFGWFEFSLLLLLFELLFVSSFLTNGRFSFESVNVDELGVVNKIKSDWEVFFKNRNVLR